MALAISYHYIIRWHRWAATVTYRSKKPPTSFHSSAMVSNAHSRSKNWKEKVTPQQTLERVRENQRRHRARRRDYITTLEARLNESEQTVVALRNQVDALQAELTGCRRGSNKALRDSISPTPLPPSENTPSTPQNAELGCNFKPGPDEAMNPIGCPKENCSSAAGKLIQESTPFTIFEPAMESQFKDITNGESTMLCEDAYRLIEQQNFKGVEEKDVATWLWNGFRKSLRPSEGCRVKTDQLFGLLAFISDG